MTMTCPLHKNLIFIRVLTILSYDTLYYIQTIVINTDRGLKYSEAIVKGSPCPINRKKYTIKVTNYRLQHW